MTIKPIYLDREAVAHCVSLSVPTMERMVASGIFPQPRQLTGKAWNFDGEGRRAMLVAIDAHEQQIAQLGQAYVTDALLTVMDMRAKGHVHQVVGVAA
ncbi:MAG: hypothetical protein K9K35_11870 [Rhodoferax sp.]|nr:hypothetical protein [Rhodoferax sp.]